ncbi:hypothetical protein VNO77_36948 [Canavalia gladiata]|uniref:Lumazine-binding domain-containing protein n=1 Tax=Canavalia gladiata TaxID=3824 RepID=A0AAN9KAZ5_CANGL
MEGLWKRQFCWECWNCNTAEPKWPFHPVSPQHPHHPESPQQQRSLPNSLISNSIAFHSQTFPSTRLRPLITRHCHNVTKCLFTGIVEEMGTAPHGGFDLQIAAKTVLDGVSLGDSIAVNGTCLTVTEFDGRVSDFTVGLLPETLRKTSLAELEP